MSLSEQEKRALREIEQSLLADDPQFGASVAQSMSPASSGRLTLRGIALVVVGLALMVGGVALAQHSLWFVALSIVGFLVMFGAGVWMLRGGGDSSGPRLRQTSTRQSNSTGGVSGKLEEGFRRRFEER